MRLNNAMCFFTVGYDGIGMFHSANVHCIYAGIAKAFHAIIVQRVQTGFSSEVIAQIDFVFIAVYAEYNFGVFENGLVFVNGFQIQWN